MEAPQALCPYEEKKRRVLGNAYEEAISVRAVRVDTDITTKDTVSKDRTRTLAVRTGTTGANVDKAKQQQEMENKMKQYCDARDATLVEQRKDLMVVKLDFLKSIAARERLSALVWSGETKNRDGVKENEE